MTYHKMSYGTPHRFWRKLYFTNTKRNPLYALAFLSSDNLGQRSKQTFANQRGIESKVWNEGPCGVAFLFGDGGGKESWWTTPTHQPNQIPQGNIEAFSNGGM